MEAGVSVMGYLAWSPMGKKHEGRRRL